MYVFAVSLLVSWVLLFLFLFKFNEVEVKQPPPPQAQACAVVENNPIPTPNQHPIPIDTPPLEVKPDEEPVLLKKGESNKVKLNTEDTEFPKLPVDDLEMKIRNFIEHRLVSILVRINVASCGGCTKDDERVIYQLKLMRALYDDDEKLIRLYTKKLQPYLEKKNGK